MLVRKVPVFFLNCFDVKKKIDLLKRHDTNLENFGESETIFENSISLTVHNAECENQMEIETGKQLTRLILILKERTVGPEDLP